MNTFLLALALTVTSIASIDAQPAKVHTVAPARKAQLRPHVPSAPFTRRVDEFTDSKGCVTRTLAGDKSGQVVTICN